MRCTGSTSYVQPFKSDGTQPAAAGNVDANLKGRGVYALAVGTYYFPLSGGADASELSSHIQWDADIAFVAKIEDTNMGTSEVSDYADGSVDGSWIDENPDAAFVGTVGAGASVLAGVLTVTSGNQGGALWHVDETAAQRTRLRVDVTTTGQVRVATWSKE